MDLYYQPNGQSFSGKQPMKSVDKLSYLNSIEKCYRYGGDRAIGAYYPVRVLPSFEIDMDAEWPIVMPAGTIVSVIPLNDASIYTSGDVSVAGIGFGGDIYVTVGVDGVSYQRNMNLMYPGEVAGLITVCNGGTQTVDTYSNADGEYGILTASGEVASTARTFTRAANRPIGIVNSRVYADMRLRYLNYDVEQSPTSIALGGVLTIPFVMVYDGTGGNRTTVLTAIRGAINAKHQYYWTNEANVGAANALLTVDTLLKSDEYGKFTEYVSGANDEEYQIFGRVLGFRNRVPYDLDELIDSFPGSGMKGMDTGGLSARYYNFAKSILALSVVKGASYAADKSNLKNSLHTAVTTVTGGVIVKLGQVDIAFGKINY